MPCAAPDLLGAAIVAHQPYRGLWKTRSSIRNASVRHHPRMLGANQYGKAETHLVRVVRDGDVHELRDLLVSVALSGALDDVHLRGDNAAVLATDTQKNTVYAFAKEHPVSTPETFAARLARHFLGGAITRARVHVSEVAWTRLSDHAFTQASREARIAMVVAEP